MAKGNLLTVEELVKMGVPPALAETLYKKQVATAPKEKTFKVHLTEEQEAAFKKAFPTIALLPAFKAYKKKAAPSK